MPRWLQRAEADFDRKLAAVLLARDELDPAGHRPRHRVGEEALQVRRMPLAQAHGHQTFQRGAHQLVAIIAEELDGLLVDELDPTIRTHHDDGVWRCVEQLGVVLI
jgi:hypothetical protein